LERRRRLQLLTALAVRLKKQRNILDSGFCGDVESRRHLCYSLGYVINSKVQPQPSVQRPVIGPWEFHSIVA